MKKWNASHSTGIVDKEPKYTLSTTKNQNQLKEKELMKSYSSDFMNTNRMNKKIIIGLIIAILIAVLIIAWFMISSMNSRNAVKTYNNTVFKISFEYPADWEKEDYYMGTVVTLISPDTCVLNVIIQNTTENATLNEFTASALEILSRDVPLFNMTNLSISQLDENDARTIFYTGKQEELDMKWMQVWTLKNNKEYVITYTTEEYKFRKCMPEINKIISTVRIG